MTKKSWISGSFFEFFSVYTTNEAKIFLIAFTTIEFILQLSKSVDNDTYYQNFI